MDATGPGDDHADLAAALRARLVRLRSRSALPAVVATLLALVVASACGGGEASHRAGATSPTTGAPTTTQATPTTAEPSFTGEGSDAFCTDDRDARTKLAAITGNSPETVKNRYLTTAESLRALAGVAPGEILPDLRVLSQAYDAFTASMDRQNWDQSRIVAEVSQNLGTNEVKASAGRLQAYERKVCGIG